MLYKSLTKHTKLISLSLLAFAVLATAFSVPNHAAADPCAASGGTTPSHCCGAAPEQTQVTIDLGCVSKGNPIMDVTFGIIKFLSNGVGIVLVGSMIWAGIQYTSSRGDPSATNQAITRIRSNVIALLIFAFAYAMLDYVIPGQFLT